MPDTLHKDLAALLPPDAVQDGCVLDLEFHELTAFALAVARAERARCADEAADRLAAEQEATP